MLKTYLPDKIILEDDIVLRPVIPNTREEIGHAWARIQASGLRYRTVKVLARNLRGKTDLHGNPYQPTEWLFVEDREVHNEDQ